jgi:colanic acid/amylovoran biosynthesis protein
MEKKHLRVCLLWGTVYSGNLGVGALTYSAIYLLEKISQSCGITLEYLLIGTQNPQIHTANITIENRTIDYDFIPSKLFYFQHIVFSLFKKNILRQLTAVDIVFDLSQGDSFTDIYGLKRFANNVLSKLLFLGFRKEIVILPQTIGPFNTVFAKIVSKYILRKVQYIMLRDKMSLEFIQQIDIKSKTDDFIDLAFVLPYSKKSKSAQGILIGINVSGLLYNGGYNRKNLFSLKLDYKEFIHGLIQELLLLENVQVVLIPHVAGKDTHLIENDYTAILDVQEKNKNVQVWGPFMDPIAAKSEISRLDMLIASRMHACIAAFSSGVPTVGVAYSRKFVGLFTKTLEYEAIVDATVVDQKSAIQQIISYVKALHQLKNEVDKSKGKIDVLTKKLEDELTVILLSKTERT